MSGKKEIAEFLQVISAHIDKRATNAMAPHKSDLGDVLGKDSRGQWLIRIRGKALVLPASALYWAQYYLPPALVNTPAGAGVIVPGWYDVVPKDQLAKNDRLALTCTEGEYTVVAKVVLG